VSPRAEETAKDALNVVEMILLDFSTNFEAISGHRHPIPCKREGSVREAMDTAISKRKADNLLRLNALGNTSVRCDLKGSRA